MAHTFISIKLVMNIFKPFTPAFNAIGQYQLMRLIRLQGGTITDDVEAKKAFAQCYIVYFTFVAVFMSMATG